VAVFAMSSHFVAIGLSSVMSILIGLHRRGRPTIQMGHESQVVKTHLARESLRKLS